MHGINKDEFVITREKTILEYVSECWFKKKLKYLFKFY